MLKNGLVFDGNCVLVFMEVEGFGDYLLKYVGNFDIMIVVVVVMVECFVEQMLVVMVVIV